MLDALVATLAGGADSLLDIGGLADPSRLLDTVHLPDLTNLPDMMDLDPGIAGVPTLPDTLSFGSGLDQFGSTMCNPPTDVFGVSVPSTPPDITGAPSGLHVSADTTTYSDETLRSLGYNIHSGVNAEFGGVYGGNPTDPYGNGPMDGQGNNPYRNGHGHLPTDIQRNPWTGGPG